MISSSWFLFHEDIVKIKHYFRKNSYSLGFVDKQIKFFLENETNEKKVSINATNNVLGTTNYVTLDISTDVKRKINRFCKFYCKSYYKVSEMLCGL